MPAAQRSASIRETANEASEAKVRQKAVAVRDKKKGGATEPILEGFSVYGNASLCTKA